MHTYTIEMHGLDTMCKPTIMQALIDSSLAIWMAYMGRRLRINGNPLWDDDVGMAWLRMNYLVNTKECIHNSWK